MIPYGNKLIDAYIQWRDEKLALGEAETKADFPSFLYGPVRTAMLHGFRKAMPQWRRYVAVQSMPDFNETRWTGLNRLKGFAYEGDMGEPTLAHRTERLPITLSIDTYSVQHSITRQAVVNDHTGQLLNTIPSGLGFEAGRQIALMTMSHIESNPTCNDSVVMYHTSHGNITTSELSEQSLAEAVSAMEDQLDDDGDIIGVSPNLLSVRTMVMELRARRILGSAATGHTTNDTDFTTFDKGTDNVVSSLNLEVVRDPFWTDDNNWRLFSNPNEVPSFQVGFLQGAEEPQVYLANPECRSVMGASDNPYSFLLNSVKFKAQIDWGVGAVDYRGSYLGNVA